MEERKTINQLIATARLGENAIQKQTGGGKHYVELNLAIDNWRKNKDGEFESDPIWIRGTMFGDNARTWGNLQKGDKVKIEAKLTQDKWLDKTTKQKRSLTGLFIFKLELLGHAKGVVHREPEVQQHPVDDEIPF